MHQFIPCIKKPRQKIIEKMKIVRFSNIVTIYEIGNSEQHRSARNGLQDLRNYQRFQRRIEHMQLIIDDVLKFKIIKYLFNVLPFSDV